MNELYAKIICSNAESLVFSLCMEIIDAFKNKAITKDDLKVLCTAYFERGRELGLKNDSPFNKTLSYTFKESLDALENAYNSA